MHWKPSAYSLTAHQHQLTELKRQLGKAETARARNTLRSEIRLVKAHLDRAHAPDGKKVWTSEYLNTKVGYITIFISPKKHRYVTAGRDDPADLIIESRKKHRGIPFIRLRRFEKSSYAKLVKKAEQEQAVHSKRKKLKSAHRKTKRLQKREQV